MDESPQEHWRRTLQSSGVAGRKTSGGGGNDSPFKQSQIGS